jgi:hypothetical protein
VVAGWSPDDSDWISTGLEGISMSCSKAGKKGGDGVEGGRWRRGGRPPGGEEGQRVEAERRGGGRSIGREEGHDGVEGGQPTRKKGMMRWRATIGVKGGWLLVWWREK